MIRREAVEMTEVDGVKVYFVVDVEKGHVVLEYPAAAGGSTANRHRFTPVEAASLGAALLRSSGFAEAGPR